MHDSKEGLRDSKDRLLSSRESLRACCDSWGLVMIPIKLTPVLAEDSQTHCANPVPPEVPEDVGLIFAFVIDEALSMADKKFIPDSDSDFAHMARNFAFHIALDHARYYLSADDAQKITQAVTAFRDTLSVAITIRTRTKITIMVKDEARSKAERIVRKYANQIRVNDRINHVDKMVVYIKERPTRLRRRNCPRLAPYLKYIGSESNRHILEFREAKLARSKAKPFGAVRLELFVDLVGPGEMIPLSPDERTGRPWYLRSFTANPIRVKFPLPADPMRVVYWGRWADGTGEVGPWSKTVQACVEGWPDCEVKVRSGCESETEVKPAIKESQAKKAA